MVTSLPPAREIPLSAALGRRGALLDLIGLSSVYQVQQRSMAVKSGSCVFSWFLARQRGGLITISPALLIVRVFIDCLLGHREQEVDH